MRILSQDGMIDVSYDLGNLSIGVGRYDDVERASIFFHSCSCNVTKLAEYKSEFKAKKAMEMLRTAYEGLPIIMQNVEITDEVADMLKKRKKQGIIIQAGEQSKVECVNNGYFQFPADNELEG